MCTSPLFLGLCWHQTYSYLRVILWLLLPLSVFCPAFNFGFLLSSYEMFATFLSRVIVRDGKMRILRSKASPLPGSCTHWFSSDTYFMPTLSELGSYFIPWIVLCPVLLTWTGLLVATFPFLAQCFCIHAYSSAWMLDGLVRHHDGVGNAEQDNAHIFWTFPPLHQWQPSSSYCPCIFFLLLDFICMGRIGCILMFCIM